MLKSDGEGFTRADELNKRVVKLIAQMRDAGSDEERGPMEKELRTCVTPGLYEHFKSSEESQKLYVVNGLVPDVNGTFPPMVSYACLYAPHAGEEVGRVAYDAKDGFFEPIDRPEYKGPRFTLVYAIPDRGDRAMILSKADLGRFPASREKAMEVIDTAFPHLKK